MTEHVTREHQQERVSMEEIEAMPALLDTVQAARIIGATPLMVSRNCANGTFKAAKCGRSWRLNKAALLAQFGLA